MKMTEKIELQALREEVRDLKARSNFAVEIISEIAMSNPGPDLVELAEWAIDILEDGFVGRLVDDYKELLMDRGEEND